MASDIVPTVIVSVASGLVAFVASEFSSRRKSRSDNKSADADLMDTLRAGFKTLLDARDVEISNLKGRVRELEQLLESFKRELNKRGMRPKMAPRKSFPDDTTVEEAEH